MSGSPRLSNHRCGAAASVEVIRWHSPPDILPGHGSGGKYLAVQGFLASKTSMPRPVARARSLMSRSAPHLEGQTISFLWSAHALLEHPSSFWMCGCCSIMAAACFRSRRAASNSPLLSDGICCNWCATAWKRQLPSPIMLWRFRWSIFRTSSHLTPNTPALELVISTSELAAVAVP